MVELINFSMFTIRGGAIHSVVCVCVGGGGGGGYRKDICQQKGHGKIFTGVSKSPERCEQFGFKISYLLKLLGQFEDTIQGIK